MRGHSRVLFSFGSVSRDGESGIQMGGGLVKVEQRRWTLKMRLSVDPEVLLAEESRTMLQSPESKGGWPGSKDWWV